MPAPCCASAASSGITANPDRMRSFVEQSIGIVTALVPVIGYETSTEIAREALASGRGVYELVMERGLLTREQLDQALESRGDDRTARRPRQGEAEARPHHEALTACRHAVSDESILRCSSSRSSASALASSATSTSTGRARRCEPKDGRRSVTWQVSAKKGGWLGGIDEAVALLKLCADDFAALDVQALFEGDRVETWDTVMVVEGDYASFAHLETLILGTLARRTRICTQRAHARGRGETEAHLLFRRAKRPRGAPGRRRSTARIIGGAASVSTDAQGRFTRQAGCGHHPACAHRRAWWRHRGGGPRGSGRHPARSAAHRARRLRERLGGNERSPWRARWRAACGAFGWTRPSTW